MGPNMPVSCENSESAISSTIRDSLGNYNSLTKAPNLTLTKNHISAALKQSLLKVIEYVDSPPGFSYSIQESLKSKYTVLRPSEDEKTTTQTAGDSTSQSAKNSNGTKLNGSCLPSPKLILYPRENVQIGWGSTRKWSIGSGMVNLGNTCYLNSTLQALFHVPSFANWLQSDSEHKNHCPEISIKKSYFFKIVFVFIFVILSAGGSQSGCIICSMAEILQSTQSNVCPTKPMQIYSKLKQICRHLIHGHQEDAHEFLRYLMESMEKAFLSRYKNSKEFEQYTKETTPINQILGGYLRTTVKCLSCMYESVTFQHFEDLLLDIRKVSTIEDALKHHFARERLEDMDYTCESCKKKVSATKQFSLERAPVALCIQLKRFSGINGKISKHINISLDLDFSQYSSRDTKNSQLKYRLVSMITHLGSTPQCGHYTAIGCSQDGSYYQFDDSSVRSMSVNSLLNTNPYIIFYELVAARPSSTTVTSMLYNENTNKRTETTTFIGPVVPVGQVNKSIVQSQSNGSTVKQYGSTSNGFGNNRKMISVSNNLTKKNSTETVILPATNVHSEEFNKSLDRNWMKAVEPSASKVNITALESPSKRITQPTNQALKNSDCNKTSCDLDREIPITKGVLLPSMPDLKENSPTKNGDIVRLSNDVKLPENGDTNAKRGLDNEHSSSHRENAVTNSLHRKLQSPPSHKGTVAVYCSPSKSHSSVNQKNEENRKLLLYSDNESKSRSDSLPSMRKTMNPFSRGNNYIIKNGKHKQNGSHPGSVNQRNSNPTNGYAVTPRKSLVPYALHDDSDSNNEDRKSPPTVKTKAGPFQVTKNTTNGSNNNYRCSSEIRSPWSKSNNSGRLPSLSTWNGSASLLQEEIMSDKRESNKRKLEKDFDLDLDLGRVKKKRRIGHNHERDNPKYNAFQEQQHNRNQRSYSYHNRVNYNSHAYRSQYSGKRKY
ncbi:Ubiquitin carboxyl-terminal hydrolase 36 [Pseudolycoriella hygida]|uniref:Ubiquitin carboxyl-terminal hydrolase n=1 Tax=Pseudolycoriella hygida TaxID=35572 RepID=A0A9Q0MYX3_9DIPT|nr:Ubiquitin carboxyl-terminal hydrolase 36 [Pseudolycoriella hygida]